jgi:hypothetical protein
MNHPPYNGAYPTNIRLIGSPRLADAPLLPPELAQALLTRMEAAIGQGAAFSSPVTVELLVLGTALRDLVNLREAVTTAMTQNTEDAWSRIIPLLPGVSTKDAAASETDL